MPPCFSRTPINFPKDKGYFIWNEKTEAGGVWMQDDWTNPAPGFTTEA
jgi:hypothetical protein